MEAPDGGNAACARATALLAVLSCCGRPSHRAPVPDGQQHRDHTLRYAAELLQMQPPAAVPFSASCGYISPYAVGALAAWPLMDSVPWPAVLAVAERLGRAGLTDEAAFVVAAASSPALLIGRLDAAEFLVDAAAACRALLPVDRTPLRIVADAFTMSQADFQRQVLLELTAVLQRSGMPAEAAGPLLRSVGRHRHAAFVGLFGGPSPSAADAARALAEAAGRAARAGPPPPVLPFLLKDDAVLDACCGARRAVLNGAKAAGPTCWAVAAEVLLAFPVASLCTEAGVAASVAQLRRPAAGDECSRFCLATYCEHMALAAMEVTTALARHLEELPPAPGAPTPFAGPPRLPFEMSSSPPRRLHVCAHTQPQPPPRRAVAPPPPDHRPHRPPDQPPSLSGSLSTAVATSRGRRYAPIRF